MSTRKRKFRQMSDELKQECIDAMSDYYGFVPTVEQLDAVLDKDPEFREDLIRYNSPRDTADREVLAEKFAKEIVGRPWPCYGDGPEYARKFNADFAEAARAKGYTLID